MTAVVMQVSKKEKHPNADNLFVYEMSLGKDTQTIIANHENIYEVGDRVIVVQANSKLKDGTYIDQARLRGIISNGMAIGKSPAPLGTDFTETYCINDFHVPWADIESLFNVRITLQESGLERKISYASKIKIDGTNAGVQIYPDGRLIFQSREKILTVGDDNKGFAAWGIANFDYFLALRQKDRITIFGEWAGCGINGSLRKIDRKVFCVFAVQKHGYLDVNPLSIRALLPPHDDIFVLPFYKTLDVHFDSPEKLEQEVALMNSWVAEVEAGCPFAKENFNTDTTGEGLVFYPVPDLTVLNSADPINLWRFYYKELVFKAKGEKHKVVKVKQPVQISPEVVKSIEDFADLFVTENRLKQIASKFPVFDVRKTGEFLKEFNHDVIKESSAELNTAGLSWKDVCSTVSNRAREYWVENCKKAIP